MSTSDVITTEEQPGDQSRIVEAWEIPDPAGRSIENARAIRDGIQAQIRELIAVRTRECLRRDTCDLIAAREGS